MQPGMRRQEPSAHRGDRSERQEQPERREAAQAEPSRNVCSCSGIRTLTE
jgi:hypothetical protein